MGTAERGLSHHNGSGEKSGVRGEFNQDKFPARGYINEYWRRIDGENDALLRFYAQTYSRLPTLLTDPLLRLTIQKDIPTRKMVEVGGGPIISPLISAALKVDEIHFSEFSGQNQREVSLWQKGDPNAYDWSEAIKFALHRERMPWGLRDIDGITKEDIEMRASLIRKKMGGEIRFCDITQQNPLGERNRGQFDIVSMNFVADSITQDKAKWKEYIANAASLGKPGSMIVMAALEEANWYKVGNNYQPAVYLTPRDVDTTLKNIGYQNINLFTIPAEQKHRKRADSYQGFILVSATKNTEVQSLAA